MRDSGPLANRINGVSRNNKRCEEYMKAGYGSFGETYVGGGYCVL